MIFRCLFIGLLLGITLSAAGQWTLLDDFEQGEYAKRLPSGDSLQITLSDEKTQGKHSVELIYSYVPSDTWEKIVTIERSLPQPLNLSALEGVRCALRVPEANPGLILTYHIGDEEGIEMPCGDYDVLKQTHPDWVTKYYRINDFRKTRWTTSGKSINLRKITKVSYHIKNDKPLPQAGIFKLSMDQLEFLGNSGLLNEQIVEDFENYGATESLRARWTATHPEVEVTLETSDPHHGKAYLQSRFLLEKPGDRRGATLTLPKPLNVQGAKYMKLSLFGDPQLAQCNALACIVLTDTKGNQALGMVAKWPGRAEWADMYLPFEAEGVEGYRSNDHNSLEFDQGSCWQEDFNDGQPWNVRTNLAAIDKVSLVVMGQSGGTYPVRNVIVKFDQLVLGHTARPFSASAATRTTPRPTPSPQLTSSSSSSAPPFVVLSGPDAGQVQPIAPFISKLPMPSATQAASPTPAGTAAPVTWYPTSTQTLQQARSQGRPCILYFRAANVKMCEDIEKALVLTPDFNQRAQRFVCMFEDMTQGRVLAGSYNVFRVPDILLINGQGELAARFTFEIDPKEVLSALDSVK